MPQLFYFVFSDLSHCFQLPGLDVSMSKQYITIHQIHCQGLCVLISETTRKAKRQCVICLWVYETLVNYAMKRNFENLDGQKKQTNKHEKADVK